MQNSVNQFSSELASLSSNIERNNRMSSKKIQRLLFRRLLFQRRH